MNTSNKDDMVTISSESMEIKIKKSKINSEIMTIVGQLIEKTKEKESVISKKTIEREEEAIEPKYIDRDITEGEVDEYARKIPSAKEIYNYIISKENFKHSFRDIQMEFLGVVLSPNKDFPHQQKVYNRFYLELKKVHKAIKDKYDDTEWDSEIKSSIGGPKYTIWKLKKKYKI